MKILSLKQPWAGLLVMGMKECETRSFNTKVRGKIGIHSSAKMDASGKEILEYMEKQYPVTMLNGGTDLCTKLGYILGTVEIKETCSTNETKEVRSLVSIEKMLGNYEPNRFFWKCERPKVFTSPIPAKGMLGFWAGPDIVEDFPSYSFFIQNL